MEDLKPYPKYKTTKLNWLNQVPIDWDIKRTAALFHEKKTLNKEYQFKQAFQFKFGEIVNKKQIGTQEELKETYQKYTIVDKDDIVINGLNLNYDFLTQRVGKVRESGIITSAYISISPQKEEIEPRYACYLLKTLDNRKMLNGMGTGIRLTLSFPELKKQYLPLPPLFEQIQMANYLDYKVALINKFIKDKKKEIILLKEQIEYLCYFESNDTPKIQSWETAFHKGWKKIKAKRIFDENNIKNCPKEELLAVTQDRGVVFKKDCSQNYVSPTGSLDGLKLVQDGDFVISLRSFQGGIEFSFCQGIVSPAYNVFALKPQYESEELKTYFRFLFKTKPFIELLKSLGGGIRDGKNISFSEFAQFEMAIPSDEQLKKILGLSKVLDALQSNSDKLFFAMNEYKTSLISDVVTGKVDVRNIAVENTEDEPEEEMEEVEETEELENSEE